MRPNWETTADSLAADAVADGQPTRWFEELYSAAGRGEVDMPWNRTEASGPAQLLTRDLPAGESRPAAVVGCGLGEDAELLAANGWTTTAFDISPTAVEVARDRHPGTPVDYRVADLFALPDELRGAFALVLEVFTVQALPETVRADAIAAVCSLVAPGGTLLVGQIVHPDDTPERDGPPWPLTRAEMGLFGAELHQVSLDTVPQGRDLWLGRFVRS